MQYKPYKKITYFAVALDPIHVGTGGYRLGRVDNTIVRDPGTDLPKIPGTSIAGVARAYTAMAIQSENPVQAKYMREETDSDGNKIYLSCAGKGGEQGEAHCGSPDCPVCMAFGFSNGKEGISFQGLAQFFDAKILLFPVSSVIGPVWITSPMILCSAEVNGNDKWSDVNDELLENNMVITNIPLEDNHINLSWLYLEVKKNEDINPAEWKIDGQLLANLGVEIKEILNRVVIIPDKLFSTVVNDNLEVRTSVAIDPLTGAAVEGALYVYEAIPRATILWFDVIYNDPKFFRVPRKEGDRILYNPVGLDRDHLIRKVCNGLRLFEYLGIGGMGTRGMGRMRVFCVGR